ncbi:MAG: ArnT family glycosyltransferase [Ilumatobacteraceae bacterium]
MPKPLHIGEGDPDDMSITDMPLGGDPVVDVLDVLESPTAPAPDDGATDDGGTRYSDPRWVKPAVAALLLATGVLYIWGLGASGWANSFYSAAVQAGTKSWKAFFFGSSDAANFITVDKPPASLWVMELSARVFGVNSWSILVPQALEGVAAVGVLYLTVRRWFGVAAGLIAGAVLALTPGAALMFRFNNPDALLVLLMVGAAYMVTRAIEDGATKWMVWAGVLLGFGFLTKMLQALVVMPAFALAYLIAGPPQLGKRIWQLLLGGVAMIAAAGWWIAIVELWPASSRPYIGGSTDNSVLDLVFGYNGFGRLTGNETGSVVGGGGPGQAGAWGPTGWLRMFGDSWAGHASWLIPAALIFSIVGLALAGVRNRHDRIRAAVIIWGGWLFITGVTFSLGKGIIHEYYSVALAPAIGALIGIGGTVLYRLRDHWWARATLAGSVVVTAWWAWTVLDRTPDWNSWLRPVLLAATGVAIVGLLIGQEAAKWGAGAALVAALLGPTAYSISTANQPHTGAIPGVGPAGGFGFGPGRGGPGGGPGGGFPAGGLPPSFNGQPPSFNGQPPSFNGQPPSFGGTGATGQLPTIGGIGANGQQGQVPGGGTGGFPSGGFGGVGGFGDVGGPGGGIGGLLGAGTPSDEVVQFLEDGTDGFTWVLSTIGANNAAGYQLATGDPVMAIGGFNGTDQWPTLEAFQQMVADGKIHYFVAGGMGGGPGGPGGGSSTSSAISSWVQASFQTVTVGSTTFYDLTQPIG